MKDTSTKNARRIKDTLYIQIARLGKAIASPKRLELLEILCQGEKSVNQLATAAEITVKLASAHLKALTNARLLETRRDGRSIYYRLADAQVAELWVALHDAAQARLTSLRAVMAGLVTHPEELTPLNGKELFAQAKRGAVMVLDVRPADEYHTAHLPYARSIPLTELKRRLKEIPAHRPVVAYCRGPFCLMAKEAVALLNKHGFSASRLELGVAEWCVKGLPIENDAA